MVCVGDLASANSTAGAQDSSEGERDDTIAPEIYREREIQGGREQERGGGRERET